MRTYHDLVLVTDGVRKGAGGAVMSFRVWVYDSPVGQGEVWETVHVPEKVLEGASGFGQALRMLKGRQFDQEVEKQIQIGEVLAGLLLPRKAREILRRSLDRVGDEDGIRLRLRLADELAAWPWEYAYIQEGRGERTASSFLALSPRISIVRHEALGEPVRRYVPKGERRAVVAMASPAQTPAFPGLRKLEKLPQEQRLIKRQLGQLAGMKVTYLPEYADGVDSVAGARLEQVMEALGEGADVFHFAGHGVFAKDVGPGGGMVGQGCILLADTENKPAPCPADLLLTFLRARGIGLAVLGACETGERDLFQVWSSVAASLLKGGIPTVVAMQSTVNDGLAAAFMGTFYQLLVAGRTVDEAVAEGRLAMRAAALGGERPDCRDWGVPVLYTRTRDGFVFEPPAGVVGEKVQAEARRLINQRVGRITPPGLVIGDVAQGVTAGAVEVIQDATDVEGMLIGSYRLDIRGGQVTVRQTADVVSGTMIGAAVGDGGGTQQGRSAWKALEQELQARLRSAEAERTPEGAGEGTASARKCPECGQGVEADWEVCPHCNTELRPKPVCPECKREVKREWKTCPWCGTKLGG